MYADLLKHGSMYTNADRQGEGFMTGKITRVSSVIKILPVGRYSLFSPLKVAPSAMQIEEQVERTLVPV